MLGNVGGCYEPTSSEYFITNILPCWENVGGNALQKIEKEKNKSWKRTQEFQTAYDESKDDLSNSVKTSFNLAGLHSLN